MHPFATDHELKSFPPGSLDTHACHATTTNPKSSVQAVLAIFSQNCNSSSEPSHPGHHKRDRYGPPARPHSTKIVSLQRSPPDFISRTCIPYLPHRQSTSTFTKPRNAPQGSIQCYGLFRRVQFVNWACCFSIVCEYMRFSLAWWWGWDSGSGKSSGVLGDVI